MQNARVVSTNRDRVPWSKLLALLFFTVSQNVAYPIHHRRTAALTLFMNPLPRAWME